MNDLAEVKDVDTSIVQFVLPVCYEIIDELLDGNPTKDLIIKARRILPTQYRHAFKKQ